MYKENDQSNIQEKKILKMITIGMEEKKCNSDYYKRLMDLLEDTEDKEVIKTICLQEYKHYVILAEIHKNLTGKIKNITFEEKKISGKVLKELKKSLKKELESAEYYRTLYFSFMNIKIRDMIFEIITDEQNHAIKISHVYTKEINKK